MFANPAIPAARKRRLSEAVLERAGRCPPPLSKLIVLLADRDRLVLMPDLATPTGARCSITRRSCADRSPPPSPRRPTLRALEQGLARATGRRCMLESRVDPTIIGGVITRLGSTVYDGSVTTQLTEDEGSVDSERRPALTS